jgi:hypothetical protein
MFIYAHYCSFSIFGCSKYKTHTCRSILTFGLKEIILKAMGFTAFTAVLNGPLVHGIRYHIRCLSEPAPTVIFDERID